MGNILTKKLLAILLAVCMIAALLPVSVFAEDAATPKNPATETADFTDGQGVAAITLLNRYKTGEENSLWDNDTKTLTLQGINFTTTAQTAVKLPVESTIVLADGTENTVKGGDATVSQTGTYKTPIYIYGIYAAGPLTIRGETAGTGTLSVISGKHTNSGNAWTYSVALYADGDLKVEGGTVTASGGKATSADCAFSFGVDLANGRDLTVTGGALTGIGGESVDTKNEKPYASFSEGFDLYNGNVSVSGGKLEGKCVSAMDGEGLASGIQINSGVLTVSGGEVSATATRAIDISDGTLEQTGGKITATSTKTPDDNGNLGTAISVKVDKNIENSGNITVSGGTLETVNGEIYVSAIGATENQGIFTVTGGTIINRGQLYGPKKLDISGGTMQTQGIDADALTLGGGTLTIREAVRKNAYSDNLLVRPALDVKTLTVSGGTLDAAWDWGEFTPCVFPEDDYYSLVKMTGSGSAATFTGGTTTLDTGKAGNTALLIQGQLTIDYGMVETGADDNHRQLKSDIPVKIAAAAASTITTATIENVKFNYQPGDAPQATAGVSEVDLDKYEIAYECWQQFENNNPVAAWYSDNGSHSSLPTITAFESGRSYVYSLMLKPKDGYSFSSETVINVNGQKVAAPFVGGSMYIPSVKTITPIEQSGGGYYVPVQKPEIITGEGGKAVLENSGSTLVITPDEGMQISKVTVNGNEVTVTDNKVTGLKTGDKVEVTFTKIPPTKEEIDNAFKEKLLNLELTVRTSKTAKKNIRAAVKETSELNDLIKEIKDAGYTAKYKFYRSTAKSSKYISTVTKPENTYTNTTGKKGTKYYYKARLVVYDAEGNLIAQTELKQCRYGLRTWSK